jgi:hypothetical protein
MSPLVTFFSWVLGAFVLGMLGSGREHGASLIVFALYILVGIVGGAIHAVIVYKKSKQRPSGTEPPQ